MSIRWEDAAAEAERQRARDAQPQPERVSRAERDTRLAEAEAYIHQIEPMLAQATALMQRRMPVDLTDTPGIYTFGTNVKSVSLTNGGDRGVMFNRGTGWIILAPLVGSGRLASGTADHVVLGSRPWSPAELTAVVNEARAAIEWVPVELAKTLRFHGIAIPKD
ncbi:hypothetical protein [Microbacterium flavum]|uniref:hypothetical protein n=1 Tax=Microbacterium flavum TaxID=415216 RepID=UPI0024ACFA49|nr:hypothetical protein [Microbacterium flavum]